MSKSALKAPPARIFVSVDESTGRSTISFQPTDVSPPIVQEQDGKAEQAMASARSIVERYPSCSIHGPHFHAARPAGRMKRTYRKPDKAGDE